MNDVLDFRGLWSGTQTTRTDFTLQVAASECHEPGGDEVVHVLASAAQVLFPIVAWLEKQEWEVLIIQL